ncbi:hypothetical protein GCM10020295_58850 [Streptomyces cinereospinus]
MRVARVSRASGPTGSFASPGGAAHRQEPKAIRTVSSANPARITEGGCGESGSGHTRVPSSSTSYSVAVPAVRPVTGTSA